MGECSYATSVNNIMIIKHYKTKLSIVYEILYGSNLSFEQFYRAEDSN